jgi:hypothetical protein
MTTVYGTAIDAIAEGVLRQDAQCEMYQLMETVKPGDLTALEVFAVVAIFRGANERLDAQQRPTAPVLQLAATRKVARTHKPRNRGA